jgi:exodeoxyribonuclease VII large subunit
MEDAIKAIEADTDTLTPAFLKRVIRIQGPTRLRVRGIVKEAKEWKKGGGARWCYGKLELDGQTLPFCLTNAPFPTEGERVIIQGSLHFNRRFALEIEGELAGSWQAQERPAQPSVPNRTQPPIPLMQFLADHSVTELGFLTTDKAWGDICGSSGLPAIRQCTRSSPSFTDEVEFAEAIVAMAQKGVAAIVLARGGGEELSTIGSSPIVAKALIECGLPFYVAIGHSDDVVLLDKHADQCFATPSDVSHQIAGFVTTQRMITANTSSAKKALEKLKLTEAGYAESQRTIAQMKAERDGLLRQLQGGSPQLTKIAETQMNDAKSGRNLHLGTATALAVLIIGASMAVVHSLTPIGASLTANPAPSSSAAEMSDRNATIPNCLKATGDKGARGTKGVKSDPCGPAASRNSTNRPHQGHSAHPTPIQKSPDAETTPASE